MTNADNIDREKVWADFTDAVNMSPSDLEEWLRTDDRDMCTAILCKVGPRRTRSILPGATR